MNYINSNKEAWEDNFENRKGNWGDEHYVKLKEGGLPFFNADMKSELKKLDFKGKRVAQFCCNNGRELLSLMELGVEYAVGFDIAENIVQQGRDTAAKAGIENCDFVACNILDMPSKYHGQFDVVLVTIGAICWFEDLQPFFEVVAKCLKDGGVVIMHEIHPFENMLPLPGDDGFDEDNLNKFAFSYFRQEPWIENKGMDYMGGRGDSKTFTSFSHTMSHIINSLSANGINVASFKEYDYAVSGATTVYDGKGMPLSFYLVAEK
ncbi:MAG: class I SAM-dependent methyltransferase [Defluviitaleaceae bacterium]|nr:class I SAM-dependent methyltransferase [Defluviitaleaceae bacterium]